MKCSCCEQTFADQLSLKNHYVNFHNVDESNHFFKKLFTRDKVFSVRKCFRCDYFCISQKDEKKHNFLSLYQLDGRRPVEDKHVNKTFLDEN